MSVELVDSMRGLSALPRVLRLYPPGHDRVAVALGELHRRLGIAVDQGGGALRFEVAPEGVRTDGDVFAGAVASRLRDLMYSRGIAGLEFAGGVALADLRRLGELLGRRTAELVTARQQSAEIADTVRILWATGPRGTAGAGRAGVAAGIGDSDLDAGAAADDASESSLPDGWRVLPSAAATRALDAATLHDVAHEAARNRMAARPEAANAARIAATLLLSASTSRQRTGIRNGVAAMIHRFPEGAACVAAVIDGSEPDIARRLLRLLLPVLPAKTLVRHAASAASESHEIPLFLARCRDNAAHAEVLLRLLFEPPGPAWEEPVVREINVLLDESPESWALLMSDHPDLLTDSDRLGRLLNVDVRLVSVLMLEAFALETRSRAAILANLAAVGTDAAFAALAGALDPETVLADRDVLEAVCRFSCAAAGDYLASLVEDAPTIVEFMAAMRGLRLSNAENARDHLARLAAQRRSQQ